MCQKGATISRFGAQAEERKKCSLAKRFQTCATSTFIRSFSVVCVFPIADNDDSNNDNKWWKNFFDMRDTE